MLKLVIVAFVIIAVVGLLGYNYYQNKFGPIPLPQNPTTTEVTGTQNPERITIVTTGLVIPWAKIFLLMGIFCLPKEQAK